MSNQVKYITGFNQRVVFLALEEATGISIERLSRAVEFKFRGRYDRDLIIKPTGWGDRRFRRTGFRRASFAVDASPFTVDAKVAQFAKELVAEREARIEARQRGQEIEERQKSERDAQLAEYQHELVRVGLLKDTRSTETKQFKGSIIKLVPTNRNGLGVYVISVKVGLSQTYVGLDKAEELVRHLREIEASAKAIANL